MNNLSAQSNISITNGGLLTIDVPITANALTIQRGGKVTNNSTITVSSLTINSDASGTGTYIDKGTSVITNATVNQWLTAGRNYFFTSPVTAATANVILGTDGLSGNSLWQYNEENANWVNLTSASTPLTVMKGFVAKKSGADGVITFNGSLNKVSSLSPITLYRTNNSNVSRGFNIVGNPFPCYVDWDLASTTNLESSIWYRTKTAGNAYTFDTYNKTGGQHTSLGATTVSKLIPPMQSFWVRVSTIGSGTLTFDNNSLSHADVNTNSYKAPSAVNSTQKVLKLEVSNGINKDETIIYFDNKASNNYDDYDSQKMANANNAIPEIFTNTDDKELVINGLNSYTTGTEIPLGFRTGEYNNFNISASEISNFDNNTRIVLKDNLLETETDLTNGAKYSFGSDIVNANTRFSLLFKVATATIPINSNVANNQLIYVTATNELILKNATGADMALYNSIGQLIYKKQITTDLVKFNSTLISGIYFITIKKNNNISKHKIHIQ